MAGSDYTTTGRTSQGGVIAAVDVGSPAQRAGLEPGDTIVAVDGVDLRDSIDWQWLADGATVLADVRAADGTTREVALTREADEGWGIEFSAVVFDAVRRCENACDFCFMAQLPKGMRPSLYLRDDDFRLSFLHGNFVTLTNLTDQDVERIAEQRLSPLYVSLHAVEPDVRAELIRPRHDAALERFDQLLAEDIELHVQIVLVPGVNDGEHLEKTLTWLAEREGVVSVGIVPVGFTKYQDAVTASYNDPMTAALLIQQVQRWQFAMRERDNTTWVHLADEFYLNARAPFPEAEWYDDYPQLENGIGMVRTFADTASTLRIQLTAAVHKLPETDSVTIVTGMLAATTLAGALGACEAPGRVRLLVVPNRFFGGNVTVTGLLTGADIAQAIASDVQGAGNSSAVYVIPDVIFNDDGLTLDDMGLEQIEEESGATIRLVSSDAAGLLEGLTEATGILFAPGKG